mmetsp:Transcript_12238/g.18528  ORF Transcript_12238/g.18528 Transcript_12238/m.18528 type:complete len:246 (-) Transcript_12238:112-849(-)
MGRPKATKRKDKVPSISLDTQNSKKIIYDSEENDESETPITVNTAKEEPIKAEKKPRRSARIRAGSNLSTDSQPNETAMDASDDEAPEVVHAGQSEVQKLKELHDEMYKSQSSNKKKRKRRRNEATSSEDAVVDIDDAVLDAVELYEKQRQLEQDNIPSDEEDNNRRKKDGMGMTIAPVNSTVKKIGHITVSTLNSTRKNSTKAFTMSAPAKEFLKHEDDRVPRIRFARYAGQKKSGPAKKFRVD